MVDVARHGQAEEERERLGTLDVAPGAGEVSDADLLQGEDAKSVVEPT